ncbi:transposase [Wukongibacter sp. M2B1]|uniref:transposase n=1 Tax=Wukongibacter sp. M2B1 TaxID=3088895 RepID=UPI003D798C58
MPRQRREKSSTGIYHIMMRGIDKREIFIDDEDREIFLSYLFRAKQKSNYKIYGYCLMGNHVHILMKEGNEEIGASIKRITVGYVQFHNDKYLRTGHLFQNRYKSEKVEDDSYLLTVLRYIHQNPLKAGIVDDISYYKWSSYKCYIQGLSGKLVDVMMIKEYFEDMNEFIEFMNMSNTDKCLEYKVKTKYTDDRLINEISKKYKIELIKQLPKRERDGVIREIKESTGVSNRQLSKVLGIGRGIIERATLKG